MVDAFPFPPRWQWSGIVNYDRGAWFKTGERKIRTETSKRKDEWD